MIVNNITQIQNELFEVIIIGSGPAGISTALELEEKKIKTLIIEAGSLDYNEKTLEFLNGEIIGDKHDDLSVTRLRQFGGTSGLWGGNCNLFEDYQFAEWPIKKNDLDIYLKKSKNILDIKKEFYHEDFNEHFNQFNLPWSKTRFKNKFYDKIKKSNYISLLLNTVFMEFEGSKKVITNIKCFQNNTYKLNAKYYVLSCGGIENSRMLLWSRFKNENLFNKNIPIGKYYMDHPYHFAADGIINYQELKNFLNNRKYKNKAFFSCYPNIYLSAKESFKRKKNILSAGIYLNFITNKNINKNLLEQITCVAPNFIKEIYEKNSFNDINQVKIHLLQEQEPLLSNRVELSNKLDPLNIPLSKIFWKKSPFIKKTAKILLEDMAKFFIEEKIGRLSINEYLFNNNDYETQVGYHQLGGTRMGVSVYDSVVDKNLKFHEIDNLFINGSSVFRTGSYCHPTFTIVQLAVRLGNHLVALCNQKMQVS